MKKVTIIEEANELALVQMFQVEELEERLENKWEVSTSVSTNETTGTTATATATYKF